MPFQPKKPLARRWLVQTDHRYYAAGDANGYAGGLNYAFGPQRYARLVAALGTNVDSLSDAQVAP
jgi:hypothetical protein